MTTQNTQHTLTQRVILSAAFNPDRPELTNTSSAPSASYYGGVPDWGAKPDNWQDKVESRPDRSGQDTTDYTNIMDLTVPGSGSTRVSTSAVIGNEFELDVESITHIWQTTASALPMPGMANVVGTGQADHNSAQIVAITLDLGMMREMITVQGVLIDRDTHPSSTSGHHIRRQHLLDIARTQWANVHGWNRENKFSWNNPNKFPALTIGPMYGRTTSGYDRDEGYYGQEPWSDVRGTPSRYGWGSNFDHTPSYKGRRRYRGLIRRLTLTQVPAQPDVWRFTFDFEVVKNELEQRMLIDAQQA